MRNTMLLLIFAVASVGCTERVTLPDINLKGGVKGGVFIHRVENIALRGPTAISVDEYACWGQEPANCNKGHSATIKSVYADYYWKPDERHSWDDSREVFCVESPPNPGRIHLILKAYCTEGGFGLKEIHITVKG